ELFRVSGGSDASLSHLFYAESWAIVDWMIDRDRPAFQAFLRDVTARMPSDVALQKHFHRTPADVERIITASAHSSLPEFPTTLQVRVADTNLTASPMSR